MCCVVECEWVKNKEATDALSMASSVMLVDVCSTACGALNQSQVIAIDNSTDAPPIILIVEHISHISYFSGQNYINPL